MVLATLEPTSGMKCVQQILLAFNALFTFTGFILISVGSMVNNINLDYTKFIETRFFSPSVIVIGIGCLVFAIALFGCYGAYKLSVAAITWFCFMLTSVFILELGIGLVGYFMQDQLEDMLTTKLNKTLTEYTTDPVAAAAIDDLQYGFYCCGIHGPDDWSSIIRTPEPEVFLPESCCVFHEDDECTVIKRTGCLSQLEFLLSQSSFLLFSTVFMIALMQLMGILFAYKLAKELRHQKSLRDHFLWEVKESILNEDSTENQIIATGPFRLPSYSELYIHKSNAVNEKK